ncbi:MAG: hypothetical protein NZ954_06545 [Thermofilaceae archaeon]|nr:hypothetical protein [Thermofilaceae archaeon]MCX8180642.1 hypothetical protein [Thermofilaceae archaeon]MDW8003746.1 hypothetical protein [Thermofilaceae archaeon]
MAEGKHNYNSLADLVTKTLPILEAIAIDNSLECPTIYSVVFFVEKEIIEKHLIKISSDIYIGDNVIVIKYTDILPLLIERLSIGYFSLCLIKTTGKLDLQKVNQIVRSNLILILSLIASKFS